MYETKPNRTTQVTLARNGATAIVVDTAAHAQTAPRADSSVAVSPPDTSSIDTLTAPQITGSSYPPVTPADLEDLKKAAMMIPVAGVEAKNLVDSFDDMRGTTRRHNALDIMAARNTPVLAAVSGRVLKMHNSVAGGLTIYMSDPTSRFVMMYGHLNSFRDGLKEGQAVKRGDIIGFVGSTGNANPLAPHLHFQVTRNDNMKEWWKGTPLNPFLAFRPKG